ncbi:MAG TPA: CoA-transferase [Thermodesulfobacteriota bacterium]|nr:CoA-transferase [Thermodesulfobacteriota bacterium]
MSLTESKLMSMPEAISRLVAPGMSIALGTSLEGMIPFAAGHELIRQNISNLTLIGPISDMLFDQMIGGGCVSRIQAAWVGNVSTGIGYHLRRAVELGRPQPLEMENHSNFTIALGLQAAALGVPYLPARTLLGSHIIRDNPAFKVGPCPFTADPLLLVRAMEPDLAIIHVQRADSQGNAHLWGNMGVSATAARAAKAVLIVTEEVVDPEVIRSDPNRTIIPGFIVSAVVEEPWGAHPSAVQGYYGHDDPVYVDYARATRTEAGSREWFQDWVYGVGNRREYLDRFSGDRLQALKVHHSALAAPTEFGY